MTCTFDAETHTYRIDGRVVPSVTQIINRVMPLWNADPWYLQRGRALHRACELYDENRLDWESVSPEISGRLAAWQAFRRDCPSRILAIEGQLFSEKHHFAGTFDRLLDGGGEAPVLCDLKSTICPQVDVQLGFYSLLIAEAGLPPVCTAVAVELRDDETFRTRWLNNRDLRIAERVALATLTVFNFLDSNNVKWNPCRQ